MMSQFLNRHRQIVWSALLLLLAGGLFLSAEKGFAGGKWVHGWMQGANGYGQAVDAHRSSGDLMVVYVYTDWCPYCRAFEENVLSSPQVQNFLKNKIRVSINPEKGSREFSIARKYGVRGYPSFYVHAPSSNLLRKINTQVTPSEFIHSYNQIENLLKQKNSSQKSLS